MQVKVSLKKGKVLQQHSEHVVAILNQPRGTGFQGGFSPRALGHSRAWSSNLDLRFL